MILICPFCQTRYDLGDERRPPEIARVRCRRCQETFIAGSDPRNPDSPGDARPAPGAVVVVASESGSFRSLLCGILKKHGVAVKTTSDGEQALEWVRKIRPDALFAAVFLRRMLGITLAERIRSTPDLDGTRIALIGHRLDRDTPAPDLEQLYGAQCYLEDTLGPEPLFLRVGNFLDTGDGDENADGSGGEAGIQTAGGTDGAGDADEDGAAAEIRRLGRVAASDLYLYYPSEVRTAVQTDHLEEMFREDLDKGRRMIEERFPGVASAPEIFLRSLKESLVRTAEGARS